MTLKDIAGTNRPTGPPRDQCASGASLFISTVGIVITEADIVGDGEGDGDGTSGLRFRRSATTPKPTARHTTSATTGTRFDRRAGSATDVAGGGACGMNAEGGSGGGSCPADGLKTGCSS